jgi:hypothetical protein
VQWFFATGTEYLKLHSRLIRMAYESGIIRQKILKFALAFFVGLKLLSLFKTNITQMLKQILFTIGG